MKLQCYALHDFAPRLIAAPAQRQWMDEFVDRHAYRCLPLSIANAHGWEALCPAKIEVEWNGGSTVGDVAVRALKALPGGQPIEHFCRSNFSRGIVTFHLDYISRNREHWRSTAAGRIRVAVDKFVHPLALSRCSNQPRCKVMQGVTLQLHGVPPFLEAYWQSSRVPWRCMS